MRSQHWSGPFVDLLTGAMFRELASFPVYILDVIDVGPDHVARSSVNAYCGQWVDLKFEQLLRSLGLWKGRGCAIVINRTREWCGRQPESALLGLLIHEAAHFLESVGSSGWFLGSVDPAAALGHGSKTPRFTEPGAGDAPFWVDHESRFIRTCAHLSHRCGIAPRLIGFAGLNYGLSEPAKYMTALGEELVDRSRDWIPAVLDAEPPLAFRELWERDTAGWRPGSCPAAVEAFISDHANDLVEAGGVERVVSMARESCRRGLIE